MVGSACGLTYMYGLNLKFSSLIQTLTSSKTYVFRLNIAILVLFMPYLNDLWFTYVTYIGHLRNQWFTYGLLRSIGIVEGLYLTSFNISTTWNLQNIQIEVSSLLNCSATTATNSSENIINKFWPEVKHG